MRDRREKIEGHFEREVKWTLDHAFTGTSFFALAEVAKYRPSMDEAVWRQNRGDKWKVVEVYKKGEWICDVHEGMTRDEMVNKVWKILQLKKIKKKKEVEKNATNSPATK